MYNSFGKSTLLNALLFKYIYKEKYCIYDEEKLMDIINKESKTKLNWERYDYLCDLFNRNNSRYFCKFCKYNKKDIIKARESFYYNKYKYVESKKVKKYKK